MANIHDIMAADLAATAFETSAGDSPAESVTYTPAGGEAVEGVPMIVVAATGDRIEMAEVGETSVIEADVVIPCDESGIAAPSVRDVIEWNDSTWAVVEIQSVVVSAWARLRIRRQQQIRSGRSIR